MKTVLIATDLSSCTTNLLSYGADLANQHQADLVVVHAVEPLGNLGHALLHAYLKPETTRKMTTDGLETIVNEVKTQIIDTLTEEHVDGYIDLSSLKQVLVKSGAPASVILEMADEMSADVIILGSHAPKSLMQTQIGSVAQKVLHNSNIPVLMVPLQLPRPPNNNTQHQMRLW